MKKTVIILEMILIFVITCALFFLIEGHNTLSLVIRTGALTLLAWLSAQLRKHSS